VYYSFKESLKECYVFTPLIQFVLITTLLMLYALVNGVCIFELNMLKHATDNGPTGLKHVW
jgi:hypothetical protein